MKTSNPVSLITVVTLCFATFYVQAQTPPTASSRPDGSTPARWSVEVDKVDPGEINLAPSFQIAIYESLLDELNKTKRFKQVFRDGDRNAGEVRDLLVLKTKVEKYTAGSETQRAVTTVRGATKLTVRSELCTRDEKIVLERTVNGDVRFMGSNLRATHNLAHNVAKAIQQSSFREPTSSGLTGTMNSSSAEAVVVEFR